MACPNKGEWRNGVGRDMKLQHVSEMIEGAIVHEHPCGHIELLRGQLFEVFGPTVTHKLCPQEHIAAAYIYLCTDCAQQQGFDVPNLQREDK